MGFGSTLPVQPEYMVDHWLDDLARGAAGGPSRRSALRRLGVGLAGMAGWLLLPGRARAEDRAADERRPESHRRKGRLARIVDNGNDDCAHWCNSVFQSKSERGVCKRDAAHGRGACYQCGPRALSGSRGIPCNGRCVSACRDGTVLNRRTEALRHGLYIQRRLLYERRL
jgi:hypothetical protein